MVNILSPLQFCYLLKSMIFSTVFIISFGFSFLGFSFFNNSVFNSFIGKTVLFAIWLYLTWLDLSKYFAKNDPRNIKMIIDK